MTLHLRVFQPGRVDEDSAPKCQTVALYSPRHHDFAWNDDFTAFRPLRLTWWDEASYVAYQAYDGGHDGETVEEGREAAPEPAPEAEATADDEIPF